MRMRTEEVLNPVLYEELVKKRSALTLLCRKYEVATLDIFGSAASADWDPRVSDLDFSWFSNRTAAVV